MDPALGLTLWKVLAGALAVATPLALVTKRWRMAAVIALLLADWAICTAVPDFKEGGVAVYNWIAWAFVDILIGLVTVVLVADNIVALAIVFILLCEIIAHLAFGAYTLGGAPGDGVNFIYWTITHWGAWLQVYLLAFWIGTDAYHQAIGVADFSGMFRWPRRRVRGKAALCMEVEEGE